MSDASGKMISQRRGLPDREVRAFAVWKETFPEQGKV